MYNHGITAAKTIVLPDLATRINEDCRKVSPPPPNAIILPLVVWVEGKIPSASIRMSSQLLYFIWHWPPITLTESKYKRISRLLKTHLVNFLRLLTISIIYLLINTPRRQVTTALQAKDKKFPDGMALFQWFRVHQFPQISKLSSPKVGFLLRK